MKLISHQIKLDKKQRPKVFYVMQVNFKPRKEPSKKERKFAGRKDKGKDGGKNQKEAEVRSIKIEKVYGDFKRLHEHITDTF